LRLGFLEHAAMRRGTFQQLGRFTRRGLFAATEDRVNVETRRNETDGAEVVDTTRARQGVTGHNVRYVLIFGIVGVVILFALAYVAMH
jgi:hypothetical protein